MTNLTTRMPPAIGCLLLGYLSIGVACSSGGGTTSTFDYGAEPARLRCGEQVAQVATTAVGSEFTIEPALPAGLTLDATDGSIRGSPVTPQTERSYTVRGTLEGRSVEAQIRIAIGPALPAEVASLEPGFSITRFATLTEPPGKFAVAPDGRVFVTERQSGVVRVIDTDGTLQATPFATVTVTTGSHLGLLGLALSPRFATDGHVLATATVPASSGKPERTQLLRWTADGLTGRDRVVLLDDLPVSAINNGGALCFDASGMLLVSVGDVEDPMLAQDDASATGKLLRIDPSDGTAAADNPDPASRVFAKGLRNTWAIAIEPTAGSVFAADNGPDSDDRLLLVQPGRNFSWGAAPGVEFEAVAGVVLRDWPDVVVPTGLAFADPDVEDVSDGLRRSLFVGLYEDESIERFELSGTLRTDIDRELRFLTMLPVGNANKPLDLQRGADDALWLLTFAAVYRVDRIR